MKTLYFLLLNLCLSLSLNLNAQNWDWAKKVSGNNRSAGYVICRDGNNNIFVSGSGAGPVNVGNISLNSGPFLIKYNASGAILWARNVGYIPDKMRTDASGNLYAFIQYNGTINAGLANYTSSGGYDILLVKMDANGTELWVRNYGGNHPDYFTDMAIDLNGNVFFCGYSVPFDTLHFANITFCDTTAYGEFFLTKINSSGITQWVTTGLQTNDSTYYSRPWFLRIDANQDVMVLGEGSPGQPYTSDYFWARFNQNGNLQQHNWLNNYNLFWIFGFDVDENGNLYTIGASEFQYGLGTLRCFDPNWNQKWYFNLGGQYECYYLYDVHTDKNGNTYLRGCDLDSSASVSCINSFNQAYVLGQPVPWAGQYDAVLVKIDNMGHLDWTANGGGPGMDWATDICVSRDGDVYVTGGYNVFDPNRHNLNGSNYVVGTANFGTHALSSDGNIGQCFTAKVGQLAVNIDEASLNKQAALLYPSPAEKELHIDVSESMDLKITDVLGRCVCTKQLSSGSNSVDISGETKGVYIVELSNASYSKKNKIVIQ